MTVRGMEAIRIVKRIHEATPRSIGAAPDEPCGISGIGPRPVELSRIRTDLNAGLTTNEAFNTCVIDENVDAPVMGEQLWGRAAIASVSGELTARPGYASLTHRRDNAGKDFAVAIDRSRSRRILRLETAEDFCPRRRGVGLKPQP